MKKLLVYLPLALSLVTCAQEETFDEMVVRMCSKEVAMIQAEDIPADAIIVDRRDQEEIDISHIPGSISDVKFDDYVKEQLEKDALIVVYCSVGYRSGEYAEELQEAGFTNVYNLYGGIFKWVNEGREVVNYNGPTQAIHTYNKKWSKWVTKGEKTW